jgi:hypothetical protein
MRKRWWAAIVCLHVAAAWWATAVYGVRQIEGSIPRRGFKLLAYDPMLTDRPQPDPPWLHVSAYSPFPFLVVVDTGGMLAPMLGSGRRDYFFWLFGDQWHLGGRHTWSS